MSEYPSNKPEPEQRGCLSGMPSAWLCWLVVATAAGIAARCPAQTNASDGFQGFLPGDTVRVKADKPPMDLARAYFQSQTASNITVISKGDRYCLEKSAVTLSLSKSAATREAVSASSKVQPTTRTATLPGGRSLASVESSEAGLLSAMQSVQDNVLGNYLSDPGYGKASQFYQDTMQGVLKGQVSLDDLVTKAEETLKKVDEYGPERAKDPRFEEQISQLRQFVQRAHNGERIVRSTDKIE
jgi:hypothetical protein